MHRHSYDHSVYIIESGRLTLSAPDGTATVLDPKAGNIKWMGVEDHAAQNTGTTVVRALITEIK